jgi:hypothetical protein
MVLKEVPTPTSVFHFKKCFQFLRCQGRAHFANAKLDTTKDDPASKATRRIDFHRTSGPQGPALAPARDDSPSTLGKKSKSIRH